MTRRITDFKEEELTSSLLAEAILEDDPYHNAIKAAAIQLCLQGLPGAFYASSNNLSTLWIIEGRYLSIEKPAAYRLRLPP